MKLREYLYPSFMVVGISSLAFLWIWGAIDGVHFFKDLLVWGRWSWGYLGRSFLELLFGPIIYVGCFWVGTFLSGDIDKGFTRK